VKGLATVVRDVLCLAVGLGGIIHQEVTGHVSPELLIMYAVLIGTPGTLALVSLRLGKPGDRDIHNSSSSSASESSSPHSS
jgi:hypothetical protein